MRLLTITIVSLVAMASLTGCGTTNMRPGAVFPGFIYTDVNYPSARETPQVRYDFKGDQLQILGQVTGKGESVNVLGLFSTGDNGFKSLINAAKAQYPDVDEVINLHWDTQFTMLNIIYIPIFQKVNSVVYGTAIKYKR